MPVMTSVPIGDHSAFVLILLLQLKTIMSYYSLLGGLQKLRKSPTLPNWQPQKCLLAVVVKDQELLPRNDQKCSPSQEFPSQWYQEHKASIHQEVPYLRLQLQYLQLKVYQIQLHLMVLQQ
jgi:hypothetical protein